MAKESIHVTTMNIWFLNERHCFFFGTFIWTVYRDGVFSFDSNDSKDVPVWHLLQELWIKVWEDTWWKAKGLKFVGLDCCLCWLRSETRYTPPSWFCISTVWYANAVLQPDLQPLPSSRCGSLRSNYDVGSGDVISKWSLCKWSNVWFSIVFHMFSTFCPGFLHILKLRSFFFGFP